QYRGRLLIYEASRLLQRGENHVAVRLSRPLADEQPELGGAAQQFYLDGWVESDDGGVASPFATGERWTSQSKPIGGWATGDGAGEPVLVLGTQHLNRLSRGNQGDAAQYDYLALAPPALGALVGGIAFVAMI